MDERGPGPRPQRCSRGDLSKRRIQISPATHRVGVNVTEVVVGTHHRNLPSSKTLYVPFMFLLPLRTTQKGLLLGEDAILAIDLDFQNKVERSHSSD